MRIVDQFGNLRPMSTNIEHGAPIDDPIADIINAAVQGDFPGYTPPWWMSNKSPSSTGFVPTQDFPSTQLPSDNFSNLTPEAIAARKWQDEFDNAKANPSDTSRDDQEGPTVLASKRNKGDRQRRWYNGGSDA